MAPPIITLRDSHLTFGGTPLLSGVEFSVSTGERLCLVGRNGSGKSTLLKIAAGIVEHDSGERFIQPGVTVRYLMQEPDIGGYESTLEYVEAGLTAGDDPYRALYLLEQLGLTGTENPAVLSGGETRRCALAKALAPQPDVLLLDEPTNHLDLPAIEWLESEIKSIRSAVVLISHDRRFLENLSQATIWLHHGVTRRMDNSFDKFEAWRDQVLEIEARDRHKLNRKIAEETDWLHKGVTARRKRNQGRLRALYALREQKQAQRSTGEISSMSASSAERSGKLVIKVKDIQKAWGKTNVVIDFSTKILRGDRIGIIGPNGAGKTTLLNMMTGALEPDGGTVKLGANLLINTLDQKREVLDDNSTLKDVLTGGHGDTVIVGDQPRHVMGYMKEFLFLPEQARTPVGALSGGERGRLLLARAMARPSNLLVLDEPTNDLDLETLDLLQEMLSEYSGTVLLVSHDRGFLDRIATSVIAWENPGHWQEYVGGYSDMLNQRGARNTSRKVQKTAGSERQKVPRQTPTKNNLTFNDKFALESLPEKMDTLNQEINTHQQTLENPNLFTKNPVAFQSAVDGLRAAQKTLAQLEDQWLELELKREELEG